MVLLILIVLLVIFTVITTAYLTENGTKLSKRLNNQKAVHDICHEYLPDLSRYYALYDYFLLIFFVPLVFNHGQYEMGPLLLAFVWLVVPIFMFRCLTIVASIPTQTTYAIERNFGGQLKQHITGSNYDLTFSGHVALATALVLLMLRFRVISNRPFWIGALLGYGLFSSMSRSHYTIDVIVAFIVPLLFLDWTSKRSISREILIG